MKTHETDPAINKDGQDIHSEEDDPMAGFPVHDDGPWPENLSLRRADLYGDNGR